jgi:hypothetical protein
LESVVIAHELVHHGHKNSQPGVIFRSKNQVSS